MMTVRILALGLLALILGYSAPGIAQTQWYTVELIVFSLLEPEIGSESWPEAPGRPSLEESIELTPSFGLQEDSELGAFAAFRTLPPEELTLRKEWSRLKRSAGFRPLLHTAWRQPGFSREESRAVHLSSDFMDSPRDGESTIQPAANPPSPPIASPAGQSNQLAASESAAAGLPKEPVIDGTIRVWRERYLHVEADLRFALELEPAPSSGQGASLEGAGARAESVFFRLKERRRMRSRKLHFLDHPMFGMLVEITPFELPDPPAAPQNVPPASRPISPPASPPMTGQQSAPAGTTTAPPASSAPPAPATPRPASVAPPAKPSG